MNIKTKAINDYSKSNQAIESAFINNYYESLEYINLLKKASGVNIRIKKFGNKSLFLMKNKSPSIMFYNEDIAKELERQNISFLMIKDIPNKANEKPSLLEYSLIPKKSYKDAKACYKRSFKDGLKQSKKFDIKTEIWQNLDEKSLNLIYSFYKRQMKSLNSFILPRAFFMYLSECKALRTFAIFKISNDRDKNTKHTKELISYCFCFENTENLYCSIGGSLKKYFKYKPVNILYNELIRYGCSKGLNIHLGLGMRGSGYSRFKENAGAINLRCKAFLGNENTLKIYQKLSRLKVVGIILRLYSFLFPKRLIYTLIPMS